MGSQWCIVAIDAYGGKSCANECKCILYCLLYYQGTGSYPEFLDPHVDEFYAGRDKDLIFFF